MDGRFQLSRLVWQQQSTQPKDERFENKLSKFQEIIKEELEITILWSFIRKKLCWAIYFGDISSRKLSYVQLDLRSEGTN